MLKRLTKEELSKKYAEKSKLYRFKNGLTQSDFAKKLGIKQSDISNIECGRYPPPSYFVDLLSNYE